MFLHKTNMTKYFLKKNPVRLFIRHSIPITFHCKQKHCWHILFLKSSPLQPLAVANAVAFLAMHVLSSSAAAREDIPASQPTNAAMCVTDFSVTVTQPCKCLKKGRRNDPCTTWASTTFPKIPHFFEGASEFLYMDMGSPKYGSNHIFKMT